MFDIKEFLAQFPFLDAKVGDPYDHEAAKASIIKNVTLPAFYAFDDPTPCYTVTVKAEDSGVLTITVTDEEGSAVGGTYGDLESAYDYVQKDLRGDVVFAGDVEAATGEKETMFVTVLSTMENGHVYHRALISHTDSDEEWLAKNNYISFLQYTLHYEANPDDFVTAFNWVDGHPAFWSRYSADRNHWNTSNNGRVSVDVTRYKDGSPCIMLEHGSAVEPARTSHYHDMDLDIYAHTYEEAFIALAKKVHKYFDIDGSRREDVKYGDSPLALLLEKRIAEAEEDFGPFTTKSDGESED